jgi:CHAT domain
VGRDEARRRTSGSTILFLAANPPQVPMLQLDVESREIEEVLAKSTFRTEIRFLAQRAVQLDGVVQALNDHETTIIHFSGHGLGENGICLHEKDGGAAAVGNDELIEKMVKAACDRVAAVVLNACYSEVQARALASHFPCVVGTSAAITDHAAIEYSRYLYRALASGRSMANAHQQGAAAAKHASPRGSFRDVVANGEQRPADPAVLLTRPDVDPHHIFIAGPRARGSRPSLSGSNSLAPRRKGA